MELESTQLTEGIIKISLNGRLDINGVNAVNNRFAILATTHKTDVIVDLAGVSFMASIGIRMFMEAARGQHGRGGRLVIAAAQPAVTKVLVTTGVNQLIPLYEDVESAQAALAGA